MSTIRFLARELPGAGVIPLGRTGEHGATRIEIDAAEWLDEHPGGSLVLLVRSPTGVTYPARIETDVGLLTFAVTRDETAVAGYGEMELMLSDGGYVRKSARCRTHIEQALDQNSDTPPEGTPEWIAKLIDAIPAIVGLPETAQRAENAADAAGEAANAAGTAADEAHAAAEDAASASDAASTAASAAGAAADAAHAAAERWNASLAADSVRLGGRAPAYYLRPRNLLDNSDFTQLVAQAGVGGAHGGAPYAGDRWVLVSGTVTGEANSSANGYRGIVLSGVIRQTVPDAPGAATPAVGMLSGTAEIGFADGAVTITSDGGTLAWAALYEGEYTDDSLPPYVSKGYAAELAQCQRYYFRIAPITTSFPYAFGYCDSVTQARLCLRLPQTMATGRPAFSYTAGFYLRVVQSGASSDVTELKLNALVGHCALLTVTAENLTKWQAAALMISGGLLEFIADL